ncbi:MAG: efflux RND transporter periplasmic adaptor subunit [Gammaproteobacteria bacterium]|nr:efflux RND transporter periplasmic adaptor subunit [Gammaproteobacteria bacterium]
MLLIIGSIVIVVMLVQIAASKRPELKDQATAGILVDTIEAQVKTLNFKVYSQGTVRPRTQTSLVSEVSGKVVSVSDDFIAGGFFREGEVLLQIDPSDYATAVKRAEAALASRQAKLADEQARSEQALRDWRNLGRKGEPSDLVLRKPQLQDAVANVNAAEADLQKARRDLQRTRITVPYDGLLKEKLVDIGQYVTPGTRLGVSFSIESAEVRLPLSKDDVAFLQLPSAVEAQETPFPPTTLYSTEAGTVRQWQAQIIRTEGVVDEVSRVIYAVAEVIDPYGVLGISQQDELRVGTFVKAEIEGVAAENVVVLPRFVLQGDNTVLVANSDNKLEVRKVAVVRAEPSLVYLSDGIAGGERVVTTTLEAPIPGTRLTVAGANPAEPEPGTNAVVSAAGDEP